MAVAKKTTPKPKVTKKPTTPTMPKMPKPAVGADKPRRKPKLAQQRIHKQCNDPNN
jgi:hypothetical protein